MEHWVEGMGGSSDWDEQSGGGESMLGGQGRESHLLIRSAGGVIILIDMMRFFGGQMHA
jgi:hypothetical protein